MEDSDLLVLSPAFPYMPTLLVILPRGFSSGKMTNNFSLLLKLSKYNFPLSLLATTNAF